MFMTDLRNLQLLSNPVPKQELCDEEIAAQLLAHARDHMEWVLAAPDAEEIWEGLIFRGSVHLWAAPPKGRKSTFLTILLSYLSGPERVSILVGNTAYPLIDGTFLGRKFSGRQRILMITENPEGFWGIRPLLPGVQTMSVYRVREAGPRGVPALIRSGKFDLIVVDSFDKAVPIKDENDNAELAAAVGPIADAAHSCGVAVILIHHHRKGGGSNGDEIRGGSALFGAVDEYLGIRRPDKISGDGDEEDFSKPAYMVLVPTGRLSTPRRLRFFCTLTDAWLDGERSFGVKLDAHKKIIAALADADKDLTRAELEKATGLGKTSVSTTLRVLIQEKVVENVPKSKPPAYRLVNQPDDW